MIEKRFFAKKLQSWLKIFFNHVMVFFSSKFREKEECLNEQNSEVYKIEGNIFSRLIQVTFLIKGFKVGKCGAIGGKGDLCSLEP